MRNYFKTLLFASPGYIILFLANYTKFPVNLMLGVPAIAYLIFMFKYFGKKKEKKDELIEK